MAKKSEEPQVATLNGLLGTLKRFAAKHYPRLTLTKPFIDERGAFGFYELTVSGRVYTVRLRLPRNAPPDARPLFDSLYFKDQLVWQYSVDYRPNLPWGEQRRLHLYEFEGFLVVAHVAPGTPRDILEAVTHINGDELTPEVGTLLRVHLARFWGMTTAIGKAERRILSELQKRGVKS